MTGDDLRDRLREGYQKLYELTRLECVEVCDRPGGCCHVLFCTLTMRFANRRWGVVLEETGHPTLPLMGHDGCVAAPHFRPACTSFICGCHTRDAEIGPPGWTDQYVAVRDHVETLELLLDELLGQDPDLR